MEDAISKTIIGTFGVTIKMPWKGRFDELQNLHGVGQMLIGIRIVMSLSQRELAETLGVHESQVSRDERNEYFGITVERVARIFDVLGVEITTRVAKLPQLAKSA